MILFLAIVMFLFGFLTICLASGTFCDEDRNFGHIMGAVECTISVMSIIFNAIGKI